MRDMRKRVDALERGKRNLQPPRCHRVVVIGQSKEEALAAYEAENGPVGDDGLSYIIFRLIVSPNAQPMEAA